MDGVHDLGGMHGMGSVMIEKNEPVFHTEWERRVFAMTLASIWPRASILKGYSRRMIRSSAGAILVAPPQTMQPPILSVIC